MLADVPHESNTFDPGMYGHGPGEITPDGSAVEMYAAMPPDQLSAQLVHAALAPGTRILEFGAGTGRVTSPLLALGHPVVAVDRSAAMLARIRGARTVCARIEDLQLEEAFDAVLLMSYLVNYPNRGLLLDACRRHVTSAGLVVLQREPPRWHEEAVARQWRHLEMLCQMYDITRPAPDVLKATIEYCAGERSWIHSFTSHKLGDEALPRVLESSGLRFEGFLDYDHSWVVARPG